MSNTNRVDPQGASAFSQRSNKTIEEKVPRMRASWIEPLFQTPTSERRQKAVIY